MSITTVKVFWVRSLLRLFLFILLNWVSLWLSLCFCKGCHLTSSCRISTDICFLAPVAIFAASLCILSSS